MSDRKLKKNVSEFNRDVMANQGYRYTSNAAYSSVVANKRMTEATMESITASIKTLIDIGCGDGAYTAELKKAFPAIKMTGTDPASVAIGLAKKKYSDIRFFVSNILDKKTFKGKAAGKYDAAVLRGVLHHLSDPELAVRNSMALCRTLIILEPNGNNPLIKMVEKFSKYHIEHEERSFSRAQLYAYCESAGARVVKSYNIGFVPFFFPEILSRIIYFFQPFFEKVPVINHFFTAQIVLVCVKKEG